MQLSEKELLMVSESLLGHMSTIEKFRSFSQACSDQEMRQLLDNHARQMERHSQELRNIVQTSAMTGTSGYSPYSQSYSTSQYGIQPSVSQSQYGTHYGSQYGVGTQSQYGASSPGQYGVGSQGQYGVGSQNQYGVGSQGQYGGTQQGMGSYGSSYGVVTPSQYGTQSQYGVGSQSQYGVGSQSQYGVGSTQNKY